jgi:hypothetical protein
MRKTLVIIVICFAAASLFALKRMHQHTATSTKNFAVLELFTSQGCNSCPPADDLLGQYADKNDDRIIPIAFHVDYWNRLGWKDSLSTHEYSARQSLYNMSYLHAGVYTPQLVVNGEKEMIGSVRGQVIRAVDSALTETAAVTIDIKDITIENGSVNVDYTLDGSLASANLNIVLIQHKTSTFVKAGENNGATLVNYNVARGLVTVTANASGTASLQLPPSIDTKELSIVLYTQDAGSGKITGAVKKQL